MGIENTPLPADVGLRLRQAREYMKHSAERYAQIIGVNKDEYDLIEKGEGTFTRPQAVVLAARAHVSLHFLFLGRGSPALEPAYSDQADPN